MDINSRTQYLGIIGNPLGHSLSPFMYNELFAKKGLNYLYLPFEAAVSELENVLKGLKTLNFKGFNVTIPFKQAVIPYLDELSEEAAACQAVNLIKNEGGILTGYNTDGRGFVRGLQDAGISPAGRVIIIGAGGAAQAVSYAIARAGMTHADILDLDIKRSRELADFITANTAVSAAALHMQQEAFDEIAPCADMIINCSPVGMYPQIGASPLTNMAMIRKETIVCDIIYNPAQTRLLKMAETRGNKTAGGLPMFINQALLTLEILLDESFTSTELEGVVSRHVR